MGHIIAQVVSAQRPKQSPGLEIWLLPPPESGPKLKVLFPEGKIQDSLFYRLALLFFAIETTSQHRGCECEYLLSQPAIQLGRKYTF